MARIHHCFVVFCNNNIVTRNSNDIPCLGMVRLYIDSATMTFGRGQYQLVECQRVKLGHL